MKKFLYLFLAGALALGSCDNDDAEPDPIAVASVTLSKTTHNLTIGDHLTLTATVKPDDAADKTVIWSSSDTKVATVSDAGAVEAVAVGTATITATAGGKSATCTVKVDPIAVESVTLDKTTLKLHRSETATLAATVLPADATYKTVAWSSSDTKIATVSAAGLVTAVEPGSATITAAAGGKSATCTVTVEPDVYVVGNDGATPLLQRKGYLWKNGVAQQLPFREARLVYVSGQDVHITGNYYNDAGEFGIASWKNGVMTELEVGNYNTHSIAVAGENVYVAGAKGGSTAYLWTNGVASRMEANGASEGYSVFVSDNDIYVGGNRKINTTNRCATYWKNGAATDLTDGVAYTARVQSIVVAEGVVYATGYENLAEGYKAVLWTDGVASYLPEGSFGYSVRVSDKGDVYVAGSSKEGYPIIWKNGVATKLSEQDGIASSVFVYGDDVYVAGSVYVAGYITGKATLWKNGVATTLPKGGYTTSVFVY